MFRQRPNAEAATPSNFERHRYEAHLFGPFQIWRDDNSLERAAALSRTSTRTLLKWFLLNPGVRIDSSDLCEILWRDPKPRNNPNRLHVTLHYLRHLLEPGLASREPSTYIRSDGKGRYWFDISDCWWTDVLEVERLFAAGKQAEANEDAESAIALYEGLLDYFDLTFLPENLFDEAFDSARTAHDVIHHTAQSRLMSLYLQRGLIHKALPCALTVLDRDPYSEQAAIAIVEVSLLQGNILAARTQLADYLDTVRREIGADPSPAVLQLWERIRRTA